MTGEPEPPLPPPESPELDQMCAEVGTCLWYLKTKHFKRDWENQDGGDDDPRTRRALGRLTKGIDALKKAGIKVEDPTNSRYRSGSENLMRPIQFQPTAGLTYEKVTETVSPIIYRSDRLIQRGEVFVAVPEQAPSGPEKPGPTSSAPSPSDPSKAGTQPVAGPSSGPQVDPQPKPGRSAGNATPRGKNATQPDVRHTDGPVEPDANNK